MRKLLGPALVLLASGCRRPPPAHLTLAPSASATLPPIDHLAPGELLPGDQRLFGLLLPRGMGVGASEPGTAYAKGPLTPEDVANYVRDRVDNRRIELGAVGTVFSSVHILGGDPSRLYRIDVNPAGAGTELVFHDVSPKPTPIPDPHLTDAERWKRAGYTPNGRPLDPMNLR